VNRASAVAGFGWRRSGGSRVSVATISSLGFLVTMLALSPGCLAFVSAGAAILASAFASLARTGPLVCVCGIVLPEGPLRSPKVSRIVEGQRNKRSRLLSRVLRRTLVVVQRLQHKTSDNEDRSAAYEQRKSHLGKMESHGYPPQADQLYDRRTYMILSCMSSCVTMAYT
jgi:hypothetical protein